MKKLIGLVGTIIITIILFAFPILTGISFSLNWILGIKFILATITTFEFLILTGMIYFNYFDK